MDTIELLGSPQSIYVRTVRLALHEKEIAYRLTPAAPHSPAVSAVHPYGRIPVLRHGNRALFESRAILQYLEDAFPGTALLPKEPYARAKVEQWVSLLITAILPAFAVFTRSVFFPEKVPQNNAGKLLESVVRGLTLIDDAVRRSGNVAGAQYSLADLYTMPILGYLRQIPASATVLAGMPDLQRYFAAHSTRMSWGTTEPPPMAELGARDPQS